jgi:Spy/CpxP family protein refolding chaperone
MMAAFLTVALAGGQFPAGGPQGPPEMGGPQPQIQQPQRGRGQGQGPLPNPAPGVPIQELQEMFDAFALVQAQRVLQLNDEQYQRFFTRMNRLQDIRRQHTRQRVRLINDLRRQVGPINADEATLTATVRSLDDLESKFGQELRTARAAIDEVLTVRQRAAFRFFEEDMERQKIDFMTRARQPGRE